MIIVTGTPDVDDGGGGTQPSPFTHEPRLNLDITLVGVDGSKWDLIDGPVKLQAEAEFGVPDPEHWWKVAPSLDGSSYQGFRTPQGEPFLPVKITHSTSLGWRDRHAAFMRAIDESGVCQLIVSTPDSITRTLNMRYASGRNISYNVDPLHLRHAIYPLRFVSGDPYFESNEITATFTPDVTVADWLTYPPTFSPTNTFDSGTIPNPGDVPAPPRWTLRGPFTTATVGVGAATVTLSTAVGAGQTRIVDMDPRSTIITDGAGVDAWTEATDVTFADIPTGTAHLTMNLTGFGAQTQVVLALTPRYRWPW